MRKKIVLCALLFAFTVNGYSQLFVDNATLFIQTGAVVTVQGDVTSNVDIQGPGKTLLKGSSNQNVNMNGFTIPNLEMDNTANATLLGNARIGSSILFTNGKITQGNFNVRLSDVATTTGGGASKFFETNGTGQLLKEVSTDLTDYVMPVGIGSAYYPASITTSGTYTSAVVGVQGKNGADPNKHPRSTDYLNLYWPITRTGITGTLTASGNYNANFTGTETDMRGIFWDGTNWVLSGSTINFTTDNATAPITTNGELYAMNRFVLANPKVFLQAPYNIGTGLMDDRLRNSGAYVAGTLPASNLLPLSDPYRTATYSANFPHFSNPVPETIASIVLNDKSNAAKNVVDWVFLELRNTTAVPTTINQTRSALLLRDGSVVDIDGISPVYFKNIDEGNFNISIRHRNHLGLRTNVSQPLALLSAPSVTDYTNNTNNLSNFGALLTPGVYGMYAGNVNLNNNVRISGASTALSDFEQLKAILGALPLINNAYSPGDVNMNRTVRVSGASAALSDFEYIKSVLGSLPLINQAAH